MYYVTTILGTRKSGINKIVMIQRLLYALNLLQE